MKFIIFCTLLIAIPANANNGKVNVYSYTKADGTIAYSDKKPLNRKFITLNYDCFACQVNSSVNWHNIALYRNKYHDEIIQASKAHQIDPALIKAVIHAESSFKSNAVSKVGAIGLMQLMPETARSLGVKLPYLVKQNIDGGTRYLANLIKQYKGNIKLATAAYNAGPTTVNKYNGIPPYPETQAYVKRVEILHRRYRIQ
ncbi:MAG: lytic transglycosylase domain-containing protein [Gammaproteobacteria bacterium]|nr:lytic transglycosylase domain-containing protein [Gammaproteobacteria bacterium]